MQCWYGVTFHQLFAPGLNCHVSLKTRPEESAPPKSKTPLAVVDPLKKRVIAEPYRGVGDALCGNGGVAADPAGDGPVESSSGRFQKFLA